MKKKNYILLLFFITIFFPWHHTNTMSYIKNAWNAVSNATQKSWNWIRGKENESASISKKELDLDEEIKLANQAITVTSSETPERTITSPQKELSFLNTQEKNNYLQKKQIQIIKKLKKNIKKKKDNKARHSELDIKKDIEKLKKIYQAQRKINRGPKTTNLSFDQFLKQALSNGNHGFNSKKYYSDTQKSHHKKNSHQKSNNIHEKNNFFGFDKDQKVSSSDMADSAELKISTDKMPTEEDNKKILALLLPKKKITGIGKKLTSPKKNGNTKKVKLISLRPDTQNIENKNESEDTSTQHPQKKHRIPLVILPNK